MKKLTLLALTFFCLMVPLKAQVCSYADLIISSVTITSVDGNEVDYTFEVTNTGTSSLPLDKMYFQTYLSQDNVYGPGDAAAGGSIFGATAPVLASGQTYTQSWYYHPSVPVDLTLHPYLIIEVADFPDGSVPECSNANNTAVHYIGCNLADLYISNVNITSVDGNEFEYSFTVTNTGWDTVFLDKMFFQTYLSADNVYGPGDAAAGGSMFGTSAPALAKDESYTAYWYYHPTTPVDLTAHPYLIIQVADFPDGSVPECNTVNNNTVHYIGCNLAELVISNITISNMAKNGFDYTFDITNKGWGTLYLEGMYFQTYLSADNVYGSDDQPAGGSVFGDSAPALAKDEVYTQSWYYHPTTPVNLSDHPYLIIQVHLLRGYKQPECNPSDNMAVRYLFGKPPRTPVFPIVKEINKAETSGIELHQNYPNPGVSSVTIPYSVPGEMEGAAISVDVYDHQGNLVSSFNKLESGNSEVQLENGTLKPGVYYYKLIVNGELIETRRMIIKE